MDIQFKVKFISVGFSKLAIFTGYDEGVYVIDLEDPSNNCKNLTDVPVKVYGASGILFDSKPMFCGGNDGPAECDCFEYEQSQWWSVAAMPTCRWLSGSASLINQEDHKSRFVIAGGTIGGGNALSNVESYDGTSWSSLPNLPSPLYDHCMVAVNETVLLSIGGFPLTTKTFFYNAELNQWLPGPELLKARYWASCAIVEWKNTADGQLGQVVVVAGGHNEFDLSSTELLYINDISSGWQPGPELPLAVEGSVMVEYKDRVILVGGRGGVDGRHLYQLSSRDGPWIEMEQTLPNRKYFHIAFLIPDELTDCQQA